MTTTYERAVAFATVEMFPKVRRVVEGLGEAWASVRVEAPYYDPENARLWLPVEEGSGKVAVIDIRPLALGSGFTCEIETTMFYLVRDEAAPDIMRFLPRGKIGPRRTIRLDQDWVPVLAELRTWLENWVHPEERKEEQGEGVGKA